MPQLQAGLFDRYVTIEEKDVIQKNDWTGEETLKPWKVFKTSWARLKPLRASERFLAQQVSARVDVVYQLRHEIDGVTHEMRLIDGSETYDITGIVPAAQRGNGQDLHCFRHAD